MKLFGWGRKSAQDFVAEAEARLRAKEMDVATASLAQVEGFIRESGHLFNSDETNLTRFDRYSHLTGDALTESELLELQRNMYQAHRTNAFAYGWLETFVKFTVGRDCRFKLKEDSPGGEGQRVLDEFVAGYKWPNGKREKPYPHRVNELCRRTFRSGESLLRKYINPQNGRLYVRFLDNLRVAGDGNMGRTFGVETLPGDVERVLRYVYWPNQTAPGFLGFGGKAEYISGDEVWHTKIGDSDSKRGWPILTPVMADLVKLDKLLDARGKIHWLMTLYAVQRKIKSSLPDLLRAKLDREKASANNPGGGKVRAPEPGSIITVNEGTEYEFKTPDVHATDGDADIRRRGLKIAVGLGFPEYIALGDSANNNYNSGELAESPFIVWMRSWQEFFEPDIAAPTSTAVEAAMSAGEIPRTSRRQVSTMHADGSVETHWETTARNLTVEVGFPELRGRDIEKATRALSLQKIEGWVDNESAITELGRDPALVRERLAKEADAHPDEFEDEAGEVGKPNGNGELRRIIMGMGRRRGGGAGNGDRLMDRTTANK